MILPDDRTFDRLPKPAVRFVFSVTLLLHTLAGAVHAAEPALDYFNFNSTGPSSYSAIAGDVQAGLAFTTPGDDTLFPNPVTATAPGFVAKYGATFAGFSITNGTGGSSADGLAQISFNAALPTGARLFVLDLDVPRSQERVELEYVGGVLTLLEQLESKSGVSSQFPIWTPATGVLLSQGADNFEEATVFDISGEHSLSVRYLRSDASGGGPTGVHIAIGVPIPEPSGLSLFGCLAAVVALLVDLRSALGVNHAITV
jgi:hypothetical protein